MSESKIFVDGDIQAELNARYGYKGVSMEGYSYELGMIDAELTELENKQIAATYNRKTLEIDFNDKLLKERIKENAESVNALDKEAFKLGWRTQAAQKARDRAHGKDAKQSGKECRA